MKKLTDNHVHSRFSADSEAAPEEIIAAAKAKGLGGITFTDHCDPDFPKEGGSFDLDFEAYTKYMSELRLLYRDDIDIRCGIELGLRVDQKELLEDIAARPWDFVIGSIHVVDGYDPYYERYWKDKGEREGLRRYFETALECVMKYDCFDSFGHLDYIFRYVRGGCLYTWEDYKELIDGILVTLIKKNKCLEVNTAGLAYGLGYAHPCPGILKRYRELGGTLITLGSDAHKPANVGFGFDETAALLRELGFDSYMRFFGRLGQSQLLG